MINENGIKKYSQTEIYDSIEEYLSKVEEKLNNKMNAGIDIDYVRQTLRRNIKEMYFVEYNQEELQLISQAYKVEDKGKRNLTQIVTELIDKKINDCHENCPKEKTRLTSVKNKFLEKRQVLNGRGQYINGKNAYSNLSKYREIILDHETTHAATVEIRKDGEIIQPNFENETKVYDEFLKLYPGADVIGGYYTSYLDDNGNEMNEDRTRPASKEEINFFDFMEICTESIAGMLNEPNEKDFEKFSIPTSKMSAIEYHKDARRLLIMAVGDSRFITDMLKEDKKAGIDRLNQILDSYQKGASIQEYIKLANEYAGPSDNKESLDKLEKYATDIFLARINKSKDVDLQEQIKYYEEVALQGDIMKAKVHDYFKKR